MTDPTWQTADGSVKLFLGDCLDVLPTLEAGSVDAVVTDPPYDEYTHAGALTKLDREFGIEFSAIEGFMGSGTTGVACVRTGRKFIGIEKEERDFTSIFRHRLSVSKPNFRGCHCLKTPRQ
jgi:DNA modification methylase